MSAWFSFYGRDFLASTLGWSAEERGHYVALLVAQWEQDGLPKDGKRLELISPGVTKCWALLEPKFPLGRDGKRRNTRLEHERHLAHERSERARQSASARWSVKSAPSTPESSNSAAGAISGCSEHCQEQCVEHCSGTCPDDASMSMSYSPPPPPPPPPESVAAEAPEGWATLRKAWNDAWGEKRQWRSIAPPPEAIDRLAEPGWLAEALLAIPEIKRGACSGFKTPPTFTQFCGTDPKRGGTFVARLLGGEFVDPERVTRRETVPR